MASILSKPGIPERIGVRGVVSFQKETMMSNPKNPIDSPDEESVGSTKPKGPIPKEPIEGGAGEEDGVMGTAGVNKEQNNPTSVPAG
jgi:hypothetical protein